MVRFSRLLALVGLTLHSSAGAQPTPVNLHWVDSTVAAGDNFYRFANGHWLDNTAIPANQGMWGPIVEVYQSNVQFVETRIRQLATVPSPPGSVNQLLGDFYASGMDSVRVEGLGYRPLIPYLRAVDQVQTRQDVLDFVADHVTTPTVSLFSLSAEPDARDNHVQIATLSQAGLALPASYYLGTDTKAQAMRSAYQQYLVRLFTLTGTPAGTAEAAAARIVALEQQLASSHNTPEQARQPTLNYHPLSTTALQQLLPGLGWVRFFRRAAVAPARVNLAQPRYYQRLDSLLRTVPVATWREKLKADYISTHAAKLSRPFQNARFAFFGRAVAGQQRPESRGTATMNRIVYPLRDLVGQLYVAERFSAADKQRVLALFAHVQAVYARRLQAATWLSPVARAEALRKLHGLRQKIGYPDQWDAYAGLIIHRDDFFGNTIRLAERARRQNLRTIGQPVNQGLWRFATAGTGASYSGSENALTLTAGYLQPPFFWSGADDAVSYGTIARTIGHEMTHAFDDTGRRYDAAGNLRSWWTPTDSAAFAHRYAPLVAEYSQYPVLDSLKNNGRLSVGENLADLVGLEVAYEAFTETPLFKSNQLRDGLTPTQRFLLSYAQEQRMRYTPQMVRRMLDDAHPLEEIRVNGTLRNFTPFYEAFTVAPTHRLYKTPASRITIW